MVVWDKRVLIGLLGVVVGLYLGALLMAKIARTARINEKHKRHLQLKGPDVFIQERLFFAERIWRESVKLRHDYVKKFDKLESIDPWGISGGEFTVIWNLFAPTFDCPHLRKRVGVIGDGGKWLCGFELFEQSKAPCVVYSFGVATESSFEEEILERTNCDVYAYDMSVDSMGPEISDNSDRVHFQKLGLGVKDTDILRSLRTLMNQNGHEWIDILKIDIEGAEFAALDEVLNSFEPLPFGQLEIEIHINRLNSIPNFYRWFERLEAAGLRAFSWEINLQPCLRSEPRQPPHLMEYSFINVKVDHRLVPIAIV